MTKRLFPCLLLLGVLMLLSASSWADITGSIWNVPEATAQNAVPGNVPGTAADATFTIPNGAFTFSITNSSVAGAVNAFVASGGGTCAGAYCSSAMDNFTHGTLMQLTGNVTLTNGQSFTVGHDDGLTLIIGGVTVVNAPGPTGFVNTPYTWAGASGTYAFQLVYGECCEGPAVLSTSLPLQPGPAVPEPASILLFGSGLTFLGGAVRRRLGR